MKLFLKINTRSFVLLFAACMLTVFTNAQGLIPHLSFRNPVLVSGTDKADNAVYRFSNVTNGVDALLKINGRSSANVVLSDIDINNTGYDSAFQPLVNYTNGSNIKSGVVTDWYMEFQVSFVTAGTILPTVVAAFNATVLDNDGNANLREYVSFYGLNTYTLENPTLISVSDILSGVSIFGKRFDGASTEYDGIDVTATKVMATTTYLLTNTFTFRTGAKATGPINISGNGRQYSLWFKSFNYSTPVIHTLPVTLYSFNAQLNKQIQKVDLNWVTSSEINANRFVVQRSFDGAEFDDVAVVFTQEGNSSADRTYSYADNLEQSKSGLIYYRLKMVDKDETFMYSEVKIIRTENNEENAKVIAYPNPATNEIRITIPDSWQNKMVTYMIYNISGNMVKARTTANAGQTETFSITDLPAGTYIINTGNGTVNSTSKFIKLK
jgi:hypothetical protein